MLVFLYRLFSYLFFILALPLFIFHPKFKGNLKKRILPEKIKSKIDIWFHASSAGDVMNIIPIIKIILERDPGRNILVSAFTNTGIDVARRYLKECVTIVPFVFDIPFSVRQAIKRFDPEIVVLEYAEIWPNLILELTKKKKKIVVTNGRFSTKKMDSYKVLFRFAGDLLNHITLLLMKSEDDASRAVKLGAIPEKVMVLGSTKYDGLLDENLLAKIDFYKKELGVESDEKIVIFGSFHAAEEKMLIDVVRHLLVHFKDLRIILAPRYLERVDAIYNSTVLKEFRPVLRSSLTKDNRHKWNVLILDTIGELKYLYGLAKVSFVGGSFTRRGGQNIIEPALCGCCVLFGPHMENFQDAVEILQGRGGIMVKNQTELIERIEELLKNNDLSKRLGKMARDAVISSTGASARYAQIILNLLKEKDG